MKALLVDPHPILLDGLERLLRGLDPDIEIVRESSLAEVDPAQSTGLDLVLCDVAAPDGSTEGGLSALRILCGRAPDTAIIVFTSVRDSRCVSGALEGGARGYIPKTYDGESIIDAVRLVLSGGIFVPPELFEQKRIAVAGTDAPPAVRSEEPTLTPRQRDVLALLSRGLSNREIARELGIAEGTIKIHVAAIFKTLGVNNRTQAVLEAARLGLFA